MFRSILFASILFILTPLAWASTPQRAFIEQFASSRLEMPSENSPILTSGSGRYPEPFNFIFESIFRWTPLGIPKAVNVTCDRDIWSERLQDPRLTGDLNLQGPLMQKYFRDCETEIETGSNGYLRNVIGILTIKYRVHEHPFLRRVVLNMPGNVKLKAILGLKGDMKARPMVVVRLGVFSNIENFKPERSWIMTMFEQSPFNILIVENMTSTEFIQNNVKVSFGGYDEGIQNIHIARLLSNPDEPISRLVDSVHMFGISLGGHGVLFSSLLNKYNSVPNHPLIRSFTALCPVVDLRKTMHVLTQEGTFSKLADFWGRNRLRGLETHLPRINEYKMFGYMDKALEELVRSFKGGLSYNSTVKLPPGMMDSDHFWELNDFWKYYRQVKEPVVIFANDRDPVVPYAINSELLKNKTIKVDSQNLSVIDLPKGVHCTLPIPYDWASLTSILSSYILSHSVHFKMQENVIPIALQGPDWDRVKASEVLRFRVKKPRAKSHFAQITIDIKDTDGDTKTLGWNMSLESLDFKFLNPSLTNSEREMIVRWLYQNMRVRLQGDSGKNLVLSWRTAL